MAMTSVKDIKEGDSCGAPNGWIALSDAEERKLGGEDVIHVRVKFIPDGGEEPRYWDPTVFVSLDDEPRSFQEG